MTGALTARRPAVVTQPRWYLSLRSPYSWLTLHDAPSRHPDLWRDSELRVFFEPDERTRADLEPHRAAVPYVPMSRAKHLYILRDVARLARERGLRPTWPVDRDPVWEVPSLPVLVALRSDPAAGRALALRLTRARWEEAQDICDRQVVARCATECGLSPDLGNSVDDPAARELGVSALRAVHEDGVFGVPYVVVGREPFWGLDRLADAAAAHAARRAPGRGDQRIGAGTVSDGDHAGGCG